MSAAASGEDRASRRSRRLAAFHPAFAREIQRLTAEAGSLEDLADSFPALLFALATGYGCDMRQARAITLVQKGRPLREAADALGLPWWLRKLPAGAFCAPLAAVPDDPDFAAAVVGLIPDRVGPARAWFTRLIDAHAGCHAVFALWIARHYRASSLPIEDPALRYLAAWAWHSDRPGAPGHAILRRPWTPDIGLRRALDEVGVWRRRAALAICLGPCAADDWVADGGANGYEFVVLRTIEDFLAEAEAMGNCLDQFADHIETGATQVVSLRRNGRRLADIEIGIRDRQAGVPEILQLKTARNRRAPPELWQATYAWLGTQPLAAVTPDAALPAMRRRNRREFWEPYLQSLAPVHREQIERIVLGDRRRLGSRDTLLAPRQSILSLLAARLEHRG